MRFKVRTLRRAAHDYERILAYIAGQSRAGAVAWAGAFDAALARLEDAAENEHVDFEVREILFKTRRGLAYRALFTIRGADVLLMHVRGPGQDFVAADELEQDFGE